jgi:calcineurin-like phosphoesterase
LQYGGVGSKEVKVNGKIIKITNLLGMSIPMGDIQENPFDILDKIIKDANKHDIHIVDFHCETTSEKNALFLKFAGKVSAILGTHTHVQTADEKIFNHTAYITDVGMTGASLGVIGADANEILPVFEGKKTKFILKPSTTSYQFSAILLEFNKDNTVKTISRVLKYEQ